MHALGNRCGRKFARLTEKKVIIDLTMTRLSNGWCSPLSSVWFLHLLSVLLIMIVMVPFVILSR